MVGGRGVAVEPLLETLVVRIPSVVKLLFGTIVFEFVRVLFCCVVTYGWWTRGSGQTSLRHSCGSNPIGGEIIVWNYRF